MKEYSNELTNRFIDFSNRDLKRRVDSFMKRYQELRFQPLEENILKEIDSLTKEMEDKYEKGFFKDDYSWAAKWFDERVTFRSLEKYTEMERYRPYYIWASGFSHPNFESLTDFKNVKGSVDLDEIIEQDIDKQNFIDPMQLTLAVMHEVNNHILYLYSVDNEYPTNLLMFKKVYDRLQKEL